MSILRKIFRFYVGKIHQNYYLERVYKYSLNKEYYSSWKKYFLLSNCFSKSSIKEQKKVTNVIDIKNIIINKNKINLFSKCLLSKKSSLIFKILKKYHSTKLKFLTYF